MNSTLDNGLEVLRFSRQNTLVFLRDIPNDKLTYQPIPQCNHALWIIGHLAVTDDYFLNKIAGRPPACNPDWYTLFGMKSTPVDDAQRYPELNQIQEVMHQRRETLLTWFSEMDDTALNEPLPEDFKDFASSHGALMSALSWHEGLHAGQLTMIRKSLGIGPKFG